MFYRKITTSTNEVFSGSYKIMGIRLVAGSTAATATFFDATTQAGGAGRDFCILSATAANSTDSEMFNGSGLILERGLSITLTGTGATGYVYYA